MPTYDGVEFEIRFDGVNRGDGSDLLCVTMPSVCKSTSTRDRVDTTMAKADHSELRTDVLRILGQRESWPAKKLRTAAGIDSRVLHGFIQRWLVDGTIQKVGYGTYRLARKDAA